MLAILKIFCTLKKIIVVIVLTFSALVFYSQDTAVNFTASMGSSDKEIKFHVNKHIEEFYNTATLMWRFGDGATAIGTNPIHKYANSGTYKVCLTATKTENQQEIELCKIDTFTITETGLKIKYVNDFIWPNGNINKVHSPFSFRIKNNQKTYDFHRALDIVGKIGDPIKAVADGIVVQLLNKNNSDQSATKVIAIQHKMDTPMFIHNKVIDTYYTRSLHLNEVFVNEDETVKKGDIIATLGETGSSGFPHNHFEVRVGLNTPKRVLEKPENSNRNNESDNPFYPEIKDPDVNPLLLLGDNANENTSLKYAITKRENAVYIKIEAAYLEDVFNEIGIKFNKKSNNQSEIFTLNFNTRQGLPFALEHIEDENYPNIASDGELVNFDYDFREANDGFDIYPINYKDREDTKKGYELIIRFNDIDMASFVDNYNNPQGNYLYIKDIYGNFGKKEEHRLVINEVNFKSANNANPSQDYNKDGNINANDDFIEIINNSDATIDISNYKIFDKSSLDETNLNSLFTDNNPRYSIPNNTVLKPNEVFVVFNYIKTNPLPNPYHNLENVFFESVAFTNNNDYNLSFGSTDREDVILTNKFNGVIDYLTNNAIRNNGDDSYSMKRQPELTGDFIRIDELASPGTFVNNSLGIDNLGEDDKRMLYPNPTKNILFVSDNSFKKIFIYNYLGKQLKEENIKNNKIDISTFKSGIYFIKIINENGTSFAKRIIKQ
jgi:hypothetical protein